MKMFRDALLLLQRSKGKRETSLQVRLFVFFALFAVALVVTGILILTLADGKGGAAEKRNVIWIDTEKHLLQNIISNDYSRLSLMGISFAETLSLSIQLWAMDNEVTENEIFSNPQLIEALLADQAGNLLTFLENNTCSGVFIILDTAMNPSTENSAYSRAGLFFTRREPNSLISISPSVYCLRGPASVARMNRVGLLGQWRMEFDISEVVFYEKIISTARENSEADLTRMYYWSERYLFVGDSEPSMVLSIPLISTDGSVYGICGMVVGDMLFKQLYSPDNTDYPHVFAALAPIEGDKLNTGAGIVAGNSYLTSQITELLTRENKQGNIEYWHSDDGRVYIGKTERFRLYPKGSPFENEQWALALLMPNSDWNAIIHQSDIIFFSSAAALLIISLCAAILISKRYIRPIVSALELVRSDDRNELPKSQITEINDLFEYLAELDKDRKIASTSLAYERFLKNLDTLTQTERAIFNLYTENRTAQQIADEMYISINTVRFHNRNIYPKLGVSSLKELMVFVNMMKEVKR